MKSMVRVVHRGLKKAAQFIFYLFSPPMSKSQVIGTFNFYRYRAMSNSARIRAYRNSHEGETIYVVGSGPSLDETNFDPLENSPVVFCNGSFMIMDKFAPSKAYHIMSGRMMSDLRQTNRQLFAGSFRALGALGAPLKQNSISKEDVLLKVPVKWGLFRVVDDGTKIFSDELDKFIGQSGGGSVIFSGIQIAHYLGATKIVLLGVDLGNPSDAKTHSSQVKGGLSPNYKRGRMQSTLAAYKEILNLRGVALVNGSPTTYDSVLPRELW